MSLKEQNDELEKKRRELDELKEKERAELDSKIKQLVRITFLAVIYLKTCDFILVFSLSHIGGSK